MGCIFPSWYVLVEFAVVSVQFRDRYYKLTTTLIEQNFQYSRLCAPFKKFSRSHEAFYPNMDAVFKRTLKRGYACQLASVPGLPRFPFTCALTVNREGLEPRLLASHCSTRTSLLAGINDSGLSVARELVV